MGSDRSRSTPLRTSSRFQSTLPHGERRPRSALRPSRPYFNPRSRMGSDLRVPVGFPVDLISIHASAWGATYRDGITTLQLIISIHAPAWGATDGNAEILLQARFQSTLPHGERHYRLVDNDCMMLFQSTLPHGERPRYPRRSRARRTYFNPRSRMGSDPNTPCCHATCVDFNPRSRMGSDTIQPT